MSPYTRLTMNTFSFAILCMLFCCAKTVSNDEKEAVNNLAGCGDINGNGEIAMAELTRFLSRDASFDTLLDNAGGRDKFVRNYFKRRDLNNDGIVTNTESKSVGAIYFKTLKECLKGGNISEVSSDRPKSNYEATAMFECYDVNGNGMVHEEELMQFFHDRPSYADMFKAVGGLQRFVDAWMTTFQIHNDGSVIKQGSWDLGSRVFWTKQYRKEKTHGFDWLADAHAVTEEVVLLLDNIRLKRTWENMNILDLGCGTSSVPSLIYSRYRHPVQIFCIDFAYEAIQHQRKQLSNALKGHEKSSMFYVNGDVCQLPFKPNLYQVIIDKGTTDSLLRVQDKDNETASRCLSEALKSLHPQGVLLQITDEDPDMRIAFIENVLKQIEFTKSRIAYKILSSSTDYDYYMYIISK